MANFFINIALTIIVAIAKKYNDTDTSPDFSPKKYPENMKKKLAINRIIWYYIIVIAIDIINAKEVSTWPYVRSAVKQPAPE